MRIALQTSFVWLIPLLGAVVVFTFHWLAAASRVRNLIRLRSMRAAR